MTASTSPPNQRAGDGPEDIDRLLVLFSAPSAQPMAAVGRPDQDAEGAGRLHDAVGRANGAGRVRRSALAGGWLLSGRLPNLAPSAGTPDNGAATLPRDMRTQPTPRHR